MVRTVETPQGLNSDDVLNGALNLTFEGALEAARLAKEHGQSPAKAALKSLERSKKKFDAGTLAAAQRLAVNQQK